jgi:phage shock protein PspC (stress-responsive transcriptional regulator)
MNKTIIININGTVFHIEEQAYELLKAYMTDVKRHFFNSADSLEITTDIENRIAEMFTEILARENRQALVEQDVITVTGQMGSVQDFETAEDEESNYTYSGSGQAGNNRRLFRDPDDHLVSGVCAGIANYFDTRPTYIRLAFAIALAFAGTGLLLYIILWIIIPKAATRADRMAMKGEKLDLQGFKKHFEAELSVVGGRLADMSQEARPLIYKSRDFVGDFFYHLGSFLGGAGKILIKLMGIALILGFAGCIIALIVALVGVWAFGNSEMFSLPNNFFNYPYIDQVYAAVSLVFIIPFIALIVVIARAVFNTASMNRSAGYTMLIVWISALVVLAYHASKTMSEFRESAGFTQNIALKPTANQVYYLHLNETMFFTPEDSARLDIKHKFQNLTLTDDEDEDLEPRSMTIDIERSETAYPSITETFTARGRSYENALLNARNTKYIFTQQDTLLNFDYKLRRPNKQPWHNERVRITLKLPLNAVLVIDKKINHYISNYVSLYECNSANGLNSDSKPAAFVMTENGIECKLSAEAKRKAAAAAAEKQKAVKDSSVTTTDSVSKGDTTIVTIRKTVVPHKTDE